MPESKGRRVSSSRKADSASTTKAVRLDRAPLRLAKVQSSATLEVRQLRAQLSTASLKQSLKAKPLLRPRHLRTAQLFLMRPRRVELPSSLLLRPDLSSNDPWWRSDKSVHPDELAAREAPGNARPDGSRVVKERKHEITLLDGRRVTQVRRVVYSALGVRSKEFSAQWPDGTSTSFDAIPQHLLPLFGASLPLVAAAKRLIVCEGASTAEALLRRGLPTVGTLTGALRTPSRAALATVTKKGRTILLWPDNDDVGVRHMNRIGERLVALGATEIRWIRWKGAPRKADAADFQGDEESLRALIDAAIKWTPDPARSRGAVATKVPFHVTRLISHDRDAFMKYVQSNPSVAPGSKGE
jgi:hypothetical protein